MFTSILQLPKKIENQHNESASINLLDGLSLIGKVLLTTQQWNSQFSKIQQNHVSKQPIPDKTQPNQQKQSLAERMTNSIKNFTLKECQLCKKEQSIQSFKLMCKCEHKFCYSCLNAYAISKINSSERVPCPSSNCKQELKLSCEVYKFLPQLVKLKYLQWKTMNKAKQINLYEFCPRCLQLRHPGSCKVAFSKENIEVAYNYRKCYKCQAECKITTISKKVTCQSCQSMFCYVCGEVWPIEGDHTCIGDKEVMKLQNQVKQASEEAHISSSFCKDSDIECFRNTNKCFKSCFYCKRCDFNICLGNLCLIPIRLIGSVIVLCVYGIMLIPTFIVLLGWLLSGIITGVTCYTCEILEKLNGTMQIIAIIGLPFLMISGIILALKSLFPGFSQAMCSILSFYQNGMCELWILCGPQECCS